MFERFDRLKMSSITFFLVFKQIPWITNSHKKTCVCVCSRDPSKNTKNRDRVKDTERNIQTTENDKDSPTHTTTQRNQFSVSKQAVVQENKSLTS